jgi:hypothetical protein
MVLFQMELAVLELNFLVFIQEYLHSAALLGVQQIIMFLVIIQIILGIKFFEKIYIQSE